MNPSVLFITTQKTSGSPEIKGKPEVLTVLSSRYKAKREILSNLSFGARGGSRTLRRTATLSMTALEFWGLETANADEWPTDDDRTNKTNLTDL